jgi:hypothetical protein
VPRCPHCGIEYEEGADRCPSCGAALGGASPVRDADPEAHAGHERGETLGWLTAGVFTTPEEAEIARGFLHTARIPAEILDKEMHIQPYGMSLLGEIFLRVPAAQLGRAKTLLAEAERGYTALPDEEGGEGPR